MCRPPAYDGGPVVSRTRRVVNVNDRVSQLPSPLRRLPSSRFGSTHAPRRRRPDRCLPLNTPIRRAPATTTNCLVASNEGGELRRRYVLGRNRSRPGNCDSRPGNAISRELISLPTTSLKLYIVFWDGGKMRVSSATKKCTDLIAVHG